MTTETESMRGYSNTKFLNLTVCDIKDVATELVRKTLSIEPNTTSLELDVVVNEQQYKLLLNKTNG